VGRSNKSPTATVKEVNQPPVPADVSRIFELEAHGPDVWVGESPVYPWGRIYGGLVIAQALWAATQTVVPEHSVHSLHGYFILGGDPGEPVRYEVDRIRNGRSFTTRRVVARQSGGAIFNLACSFQRHEEGVETQTADYPADAPDPNSVISYREASGVDRIDVKVSDRRPRSLVWCRFPQPLDDDPRLHACALAYLSDTSPMDAVATAHPLGVPPEGDWHRTYMTASLDHAMWFHRPAQADDWLLLDLDGHGIIRTRGLSTGHVFTDDGQHIATIAQEGLIRQLDQ
jgi:acyl-CoA thioesterase-2